ncbi:hypothetical protein [Nocardioides sp.]|uniref:hypothetical protein n=1 Tax=Nocardioides sp. TaxID=35761 RepID=UPI002717922A|nr:hypothetical protein [Nocardioides sp.]MDO9456737.1 hypothetical protein [Nocardioides sp.]
MRRTVLVLTTAITALLVVLGGAPALADSRVDVTNDRGGDQADLTYQTKLTIEGDGFQVVRGGFGGVYVLFGWVKDPGGGAWRPSRGGLTGRDYQYIPDAESTEDSKGYLRFVAFPGGSTAGEAAAVLSPSGGFTVDMTVPGPVFQSVDRDGEVAEVDCRTVTCGVITIGAHGVKNARNETFTPVRFASVYDAAPATAPTTTPTTAAPTATASETPGSTASTAPAAGSPTTGAPQVAVGTPAVTVDRPTAVSGRAMSFSAQGFTPGEQVVATLDDGVAALGPMLAGTSGEVAGVLQLPADLGVGTHELRVTGAASGTEASELFPVAAGDAPAQASTSTPGDGDGDGNGDDQGGLVFLGVAALAFLLALVAFAVVRLRGRRTVGQSGPAGPTGQTSPA